MVLSHPFKEDRLVLPLSTPLLQEMMTSLPAGSVSSSSTHKIFWYASHLWWLLCLPVYPLGHFALSLWHVQDTAEFPDNQVKIILKVRCCMDRGSFTCKCKGLLTKFWKYRPVLPLYHSSWTWTGVLHSIAHCVVCVFHYAQVIFSTTFPWKKNEHTIVVFSHAYTDGHTVSVQCRERERMLKWINTKPTHRRNKCSVFHFFIFSSKILLVALAVMTGVATSDMGTKKKKLQMWYDWY